MTTFLFWNIKNRPIHQTIASLVAEQDVDIVILAECEIQVGDMLKALNTGNSGALYDKPMSQCERVIVYTRFPANFLVAKREAAFYSIYELELPGQTKIILAVTHLESKLYVKSYDQEREARFLAEDIAEVENQVGHANTILVGDLNMNPFETGVVAEDNLRGVMTKDLARKQSGKGNRPFYNPMWGHFGDRTFGPAGTYYYKEAGQVRLFWHMFDQVLLRPDIIPLFQDKDLSILTKCGNDSLLSKNGLPKRSKYSDHLPIVFKLNL